MNLRSEIEGVLIENAIGKMTNESFLKLIRDQITLENAHHLDLTLIEYEHLDSRMNQGLTEGCAFAQSVLSRVVNLKKLEQARLNQLLESGERIVPVKAIPNAFPFKGLSGGTFLSYLGTDEKIHDLALFFPFSENQIHIGQLPGAFYLDKKLVPIRSAYEENIIDALTQYKAAYWTNPIKEIVDFVHSKEYIKIARKIKRID